MTKLERIKLCEAIRLIHADEGEGDYFKGMGILCGLAVVSGYKQFEVKPISLSDLSEQASKDAKTKKNSKK